MPDRSPAATRRESSFPLWSRVGRFVMSIKTHPRDTRGDARGNRDFSPEARLYRLDAAYAVAVLMSDGWMSPVDQ